MKNRSKINLLLQSWPHPTVMTMKCLKNRGYSYELVGRYLKNGWIESLGNGAYIKSGSEVTWLGGVYALQTQLFLNVHIGGLTALSLQGRVQYAPFGKDTLHLFASPKTKLPTWFSKYDWGLDLSFVTAHLFDDDQNLGLVDYEESRVLIKISSRERAILELLYGVPQKISFNHAEEIFEGLLTLNPELLQTLLEKCRSIKTKRIFLYLAEKNSYPWFEKLNLKKIDIGKGKRVVAKNGRLDPEYLITVPVSHEELYDKE